MRVSYISAVVEEVSGEGVAKDPIFSVITWKQLHLLLFLLVFAFNLNTDTETCSVFMLKKQKMVTLAQQTIIGQ